MIKESSLSHSLHQRQVQRYQSNWSMMDRNLSLPCMPHASWRPYDHHLPTNQRMSSSGWMTDRHKHSCYSSGHSDRYHTLRCDKIKDFVHFTRKTCIFRITTATSKKWTTTMTKSRSCAYNAELELDTLGLQTVVPALFINAPADRV